MGFQDVMDQTQQQDTGMMHIIGLTLHWKMQPNLIDLWLVSMT